MMHYGISYMLDSVYVCLRAYLSHKVEEKNEKNHDYKHVLHDIFYLNDIVLARTDEIETK